MYLLCMAKAYISAFSSGDFGPSSEDSADWESVSAGFSGAPLPGSSPESWEAASTILGGGGGLGGGGPGRPGSAGCWEDASTTLGPGSAGGSAGGSRFIVFPEASLNELGAA